MLHKLFGNTSLFDALYELDRIAAGVTRERGCPCGGRLHAGHYLRKPRGEPETLPEEQRLRFSFCCGRDGCRRRVMSPSTRFLGRHVYIAAIVVLGCALQNGITERRVKKLKSVLGPSFSRRTLVRWQVYWRTTFPQTAFYRSAKGQLQSCPADEALPGGLLAAFEHHSATKRCIDLLCWLAPMTGAQTTKVLQGP